MNDRHPDLDLDLEEQERRLAIERSAQADPNQHSMFDEVEG